MSKYKIREFPQVSESENIRGKKCHEPMSVTENVTKMRKIQVKTMLF